MLFFENCVVNINGSGVLAESATISSVNTLEPVYQIGKRGIANQVPAGPIQGNFDISFFSNINGDPIHNLHKTYKKGKDPEKVEIVVAGITGNGYLASYSVDANPNSFIKGNASFNVFESLQGDLTSQTADSNLTNALVANGWTTVVKYHNTYNDENTYQFQYQLNNNIQPIYIIGKKEPHEVELLSVSESMRLTRDVFKDILFSGEDVCNELFDCEDDNIKTLAVELTCDLEDDINTAENTSSGLSFDISGGYITESNVQANLDDFVRVTLTIDKFN